MFAPCLGLELFPIAEHAANPAPVGAAVAAGAFGRQVGRDALEVALFFHKVVAGPKFGNIGELLDLTGNPTFDLTDSHSVIEAVAHARQLANTGYGEKNAEFARQNMNTELIAQKTILCYQQIYNLTLHENPTDR